MELFVIQSLAFAAYYWFKTACVTVWKLTSISQNTFRSDVILRIKCTVLLFIMYGLYYILCVCVCVCEPIHLYIVCSVYKIYKLLAYKGHPQNKL